MGYGAGASCAGYGGMRTSVGVILVLFIFKNNRRPLFLTFWDCPFFSFFIKYKLFVARNSAILISDLSNYNIVPKGRSGMIGKRVQQLRKEKGMSLTELAERAGVAKSYISSLERDIQTNPSIQFLEKIASALKVSMDRLVDQGNPVSAELDQEWYDIIQEAMTSGVDKQQFRESLEFNKWRMKRP
jgi:XRE family transcriptional regulator of biofilm formation